MRLIIDFAATRWRMTWRAMTLGAVAVALAFIWASWAMHLERGIEQLRQEVAAAEGSKRSRAIDRERSRPTLSAERAIAVNGAIHLLNLPWETLLPSIASAASADVALLSVEPDGTMSAIRLTAEARSYEAALVFRSRLESQPSIRAATLLKHELLKDRPGSPVRFGLSVRWEAER